MTAFLEMKRCLTENGTHVSIVNVAMDKTCYTHNLGHVGALRLSSPCLSRDRSLDFYVSFLRYTYILLGHVGMRGQS